MNKPVLTLVIVALVALSGCSALPGTGQSDAGDGVGNGVDVGDDSAGATAVTQSVSIEVDEAAAGQELTEVGATYPREHFVVDAAQHDQIRVGVDTDGDGEAEETFDETHVSGVNNNAFSFDVTLDTGYTLESGDVVMVEYPAVDNPDEAGEYTVELRVNDEQTNDGTVRIE